ncbi:MAG: hypothetical protein J6V82_00855 [Clostridia bacterium]|nr:hypothetical protein [Clostridia bacterium]MBO7150279.1 hypothetical protein [Clostridia bacterium]
MLSFCKKLFPFAFCIRTLQRFLWTLLILSASCALVLFGAVSLFGLGTVGPVFSMVFLVAFLYGAVGIALSILYFLEVIE